MTKRLISTLHKQTKKKERNLHDRENLFFVGTCLPSDIQNLMSSKKENSFKSFQRLKYFVQMLFNYSVQTCLDTPFFRVRTR